MLYDNYLFNIFASENSALSCSQSASGDNALKQREFIHNGTSFGKVRPVIMKD
jgi:hypothetical protein